MWVSLASVSQPPPARTLPEKAADTSAENPWPLRVLTTKISKYIMRMPVAWVEGQVLEISRRGDSSVVFLTLRDTDVDMSLSLTTGRRILDAMPTPLVEGARVVARVVPEYWEKRGRFSLTALDIRPVGLGALLAQIEHLRQLLAAEGLFDDRLKKRLPFAPDVVGLVCGRDSDAERDVVVNTQHRWPATTFEIRRVPVQGSAAVNSICQAITELDADPRVEVIVVARGGGSLEDLLPFSNETLVRTAANCSTPIVSAIGHEADSPLLDLVCDLRASTPTDAAKRLVPDVTAELNRVDDVRARLRRAMTLRVDGEQSRLDSLRARPGLASPTAALDAQADVVMSLRHRGTRSVHVRLERAEDDIAHILARVRALSPKATLERGYAVVLDEAGHVVTDAADTTTGAQLQVLLATGRLTTQVTQAHGD